MKFSSKSKRQIDKVFNSYDQSTRDRLIWKDEVFCKYGVTIMYGKTWEATALKLNECNMINMNDKWVNGESYQQLLDNAIKNGIKWITERQINVLCAFGNLAEEFAHTLVLHEMASILFNRKWIGISPGKVKILCRVCSREIRIVYATALTILRCKPYLFGKTYEFSNLFDLNTADTIVYLMGFSSFSDEDLRKLNLMVKI